MAQRRSQAERAALKVVKRLRAAGYTALLAGGCVRDELLGREPKDYDVVTDALPEDVRRCFPKSRAVGQQFGVILVRGDGHVIEVATFRSDGGYSDGRRPDNVTFGGALEDARRRDFTINGLFRDPVDGRIIDHVGGVEDLHRRVIRTIGSPADRFAEDHLRMLRAVRFAALLDFTIEPDTLAGIRRLADRLERISAERIWMELERILADPGRARGWDWLVRADLHDHLVPEWRWTASDLDVIGKRLAALPSTNAHATLGLACLLVSYAPPDVTRFCRRLRVSNQQVDRTVWLVSRLDPARRARELELADVKAFVAHDAGDDLLHLLRADLIARESAVEPWEVLWRRMADVDPKDAAPPPLLTGDDLIQAGVRPGPAMGHALQAAYRAQLNETISTPDQARAVAMAVLRDN